jgi:phytoene dehydrogenase-like protein
MVLASPFFKSFGIERRVELLQPKFNFAQPIDASRVVAAATSIEDTAETLGADGAAWARFFRPMLRRLEGIEELVLSSPLRFLADVPAAGLLAVHAAALLPIAGGIALRGPSARALLSGVQAHANAPLSSPAAAGVGLTLALLGHAHGWPVPRGGSQSIATALIDDFLEHGGVIRTSFDVADLRELPTSAVRLLDISPRAFLRVTHDELPSRYARALARFRYGPAVAKVDFLLSDAAPWSQVLLRDAGTVHLGGSRGDVAASEAEVARGRVPERPFVIVGQPSAVDVTRTNDERHVLWAYMHVPAGLDFDATEMIASVLERYAPGFRETVVWSKATTARDYETLNPNIVGGDIYTGAMTTRQLMSRPVLSPSPWRTPLKGTYLCSAATSPGPGVHGMSGFRAAELALREVFGIASSPALATFD